MKDDAPSPPKADPILIIIELCREPLPGEHSVISRINKKIPESEISLRLEGQNLIAALYKLDPHHYHSILMQYIQESGLSDLYTDALLNPFDMLMQKILANGSYGIRYRKRVYAGYADERKVIGRKEKEAARESYFYARGNDFQTVSNSLPEEYVNQIICGDSEEILKNFPDNCIDLIITSPPYNFGLAYSSSGDSNHWQDYLDKLYRVFTQGIRVLKHGGRFIVNVQPLFSDYIPLHHLVSSFFMNQKMIWKGEILWEKNNYNCKYTSWGSWKSPSSPYLKYTWEFIEIFCKGSLKKTGNSENADISDEEFKSWVVAKWSIGTEKRMKQFNHPAMFPEELVERCLKLFSFQGDIILDPFNGAGTTTAVAAKTGRSYVGIDISSEYCTSARERIVGNAVSSRDTPEKKGIQSKKPLTSAEPSPEPRRRGRPPKQQIQKEESSQHHLDGFYSDPL